MSGNNVNSISIRVAQVVLLATAPTYFFSTYRNLFVDPAYAAVIAFSAMWFAVLLLSLRRVPLAKNQRVIGLGSIIFLVSVVVVLRNQNLQAGLMWATFSISMFSLIVPRKLHLLISATAASVLTFIAVRMGSVDLLEGLKVGSAGFAIIYGVITIPAMLFRELEKRTLELTKASRAKSDFLANMSHEIRTPLNGIFGSLQVIRGSLQDQSTVARYTDVAMQSYHSIIGIVNDVLDLSKLAENKVEIYPEPSNVAELVSLVSSEMRAVALNKGIDLSSSCSPELAGQTRLIDRTRVTQVLRNLLSNAVKFTSSGSVSIDVQTGDNSDEVVIRITDTGVGIPEDKQAAIFEPFEQVEGSRAVERSGTGLGLPISKHLVELMGGSITLTSTEGVGTTFTVLLRLPQTSLARTDKRGAIDVSKLQPARILLAEDVMTNRMIFNALLKDCPYTIDEVENGELAVEKALSEDYDLVFLDIQMPVMDGLSALHALKTVDYPKPIIACTANVMKEDVAQYMDAGFDSVMGKPYLKEDLVACIQAAVTRGRFTSTDR